MLQSYSTAAHTNSDILTGSFRKIYNLPLEIETRAFLFIYVLSRAHAQCIGTNSNSVEAFESNAILLYIHFINKRTNKKAYTYTLLYRAALMKP